MHERMPDDETLRVLSDLISFDTVSCNSNIPLIDHLEGWLGQLGIATQRIDGTPGKQSLVATIGPADVPGIILSAHTDVVPVANQPWSDDPFTVRIGNGRATGRGVTDMKGFAACVLAKVPAMLAAPLRRPVHIVLTHDEEVGCLAMPFVVRAIETWPVRPMAAIVGEPTTMGVIVAHKGKISYRVEVRGRSGHSALSPNACNAVEYAADLVVFIRDIGRRLEKTEQRDHSYDVPFTTAHTGPFHGGAALNIVPDRCEFEFEFRALPETSLQELSAEVQDYAHSVLLPRMRSTAPEAEIIFHPRSHIPGLDTATGSAITELALDWSGTLAAGTAKVAYGTEAGFYQKKLGIPTVVCGPGDISDAHLPDESIALSQLARCEQFLDNLIAWCAGRNTPGADYGTEDRT